MTLRSHDNRSTVELAVVAKVVQVALGIRTLNGRSQITDSLLGANNSCRLAIGSSLNMGNQVKQLFLVIRTRSREVSNTAKVVGSSSAPQGVDIVQKLLTERLSNLADERVEINTTRKDAVELFVNLHNLQRGRNRNFADATQTLTANALRTICSFRHDKEIAVFNLEKVLVAFGNIAEINQSIEILIALQTLNDSTGENLLNQRKQTAALAVADVFIVKGSAAAIGINQSLMQKLH